jgi:hypothetical protein
MRSIVIQLAAVVVQVLLFYAAFRLCQMLLAEVSPSALCRRGVRKAGSQSPFPSRSAPARYRLPEKASDSR